MKDLIRTSLLYLTVSFLFASCHTGYVEKDGKIYYKWIHGGNWAMKNTLVTEADASSFETIKNNIGLDLGKDKNHVFEDASILEHADLLLSNRSKSIIGKIKIMSINYNLVAQTVEFKPQTQKLLLLLKTTYGQKTRTMYIINLTN